MKIRCCFIFMLLFFISSTLSAGVLDATKDLEGKIVVIAGDVETLDCPISDKYDCLSWPFGLLRFKYRDVCFTTDIGTCGIFCKGFIAVGKDEIPYFFIVEEIGGDIKKHNVKYYKCPDMY